MPDFGHPLRILSLSTVFPNPKEPGLGLFVQSRLQHIARLAGVRVIAPLPVLDYSNPHKQLTPFPHGYPLQSRDGLEVVHPRWLYPPLGTPFNVACLVARVWPVARRLYRERPFDLIDAHFGYPEGVAAAFLARLFGVPFTITLRGSEIAFSNQSSIRRSLIAWAIRQAAGVITVSEELRRFAIAAGAQPERVRTIPNGVNSTVFHPRPQAQCRAQYGFSPHRKLILSAGELIEAKGHHRVIQALPALLQAGFDAEVAIAGGVARGGPRYEEQLRQRIAGLGLQDRVRLLGWMPREALAEIMAAADLFCLHSDTEGWPNVVHEALSCGTPVVVSRVGAVPEMVPNETLGLIVPPKEQDALTAALHTALGRSWDRQAIADWGRARGWDRVAQEVVTEFQRIVSLSRATSQLTLPEREADVRN